MTDKLYALVLYSRDNVGTLLTSISASETVTLKGVEGTVTVQEDIDSGHKVALKTINKGQDIVKYGHKIGIATEDIKTGEWVHIHNMTSAVDLTFKQRLEH